MSFELVDTILKGGPERSPDKIILVALASFVNAKTGRCDPSMSAVAERASMTERGARSIIRRLEADGWLSVSTGGGRAGCSTYQINTERHSGFAEENPEHGSPFRKEKPGTPCTETRNATTQNPERHSVNPERGSAEPVRTRKNKEGGNPPAGADCAAIDGEILSDAAGDNLHEAQFAAIFGNWPRKSGEAEARKAFDAAIASGASIEDIARGAAAYVVDRRSDRRGPAAVVRYTTGLAKWLAGREWEAWTGLPEAEARAAARHTTDLELIQERARARDARRYAVLKEARMKSLTTTRQAAPTAAPVEPRAALPAPLTDTRAAEIVLAAERFTSRPEIADCISHGSNGAVARLPANLDRRLDLFETWPDTKRCLTFAAQIDRALTEAAPGELEGLIAAGMLPAMDGDKLPMVDAIHAYLGHLREASRNASASAAQARARDARAEASELALAIARRDVIPEAEAETATDFLCGVIADQVGGLPARVTRDLRARRAIEDALRRAQEAIATDLAAAD